MNGDDGGQVGTGFEFLDGGGKGLGIAEIQKRTPIEYWNALNP